MDEKIQLLQLLEEKKRREKRRKLYTFFPETGPLRRELYGKHMEFFRAGKKYRERGFMAANRIGKTESAGGYETTLHLTGLYPDWWEGRVFNRPIRAWVAGDTNETTRDILQTKLLGPYNDMGTGIIPGDCMPFPPTRKAGFPNAIESVYVQHVSGGYSTLRFKSYVQGRKSFQGTEQDLIWLDEEPPEDIYGESLIRTMTTKGIIMCTFTPLEGITPVVLSFLPGGKLPEGKVA